MNRGQLKKRVSLLLGVALGTDDDAIEEMQFLEELANEAVLDVLTRTRICMQESLISLDGQDEVDLKDTMLRVGDVRLNSTLLSEGPRNALLPDQFAFIGFNVLKLGVIPQSGDTLTFWSVPKPQPMRDDGDDPSEEQFGCIPSFFHKALVDYMCWWAADKLGDMQAGRGERYRTMYEGQDGMAGPGSDIGKIRLAITSRGGNTLVRRRREYLVSDRDPQYWQG